MIVCDQLRIKQVLINLIKNSVDFVPNQNGKISVIVEHPTEASIPFEFQSSHTNDSKSDNIMIAVTDNGKGIPSEKVHNLFRKFYQVDPKATRRHGGTGLGLTICKEIVEAHGGKIWYDAATSAYNGACFRFVLPRHPHSASGIR
jgi:signal transduction histidine kinase